MLAASAGMRVTVLEARSQVGGRTSTFEHGGYRFDLGPTFFLYPEAARSLFRMAGRSFDQAVDLQRVDPHYQLVFGGRDRLSVTPDPEDMARRIARLAPEDAAAFPRFLSENRHKLERFKPILQRPFSSALDLLQLPLLHALPLLRPWASVDADLKRYFSDPRIRLAFSFQSKYLGMSPFQCPSLFTILSFMEYEYGIFHPRGGCGAVSEAMATAATESGASIQLDTEVVGMDFDGRRVKAVRTADETIPCDAVVMNADFAHGIQRLVPDRLRRRWSNRNLEKKKYSCSTFMMYLGLEGEVDLPHHSIFLAEDYRSNLDAIESGRRVPEEPSFYVCNPAATDPTMAPEGQSALYVLVPVAHGGAQVDWAREEAGFRNRTLRQLEAAGVHDVERRIRFEKVMTPTRWAEDLRIFKGATFSLAHTLRQMLHLRPQNRFDEVDGLYLVGGGTHPGSGLPVIYESAKITARLLAEDLGVHAAWDEDADRVPPTPLLQAEAG